MIEYKNSDFYTKALRELMQEESELEQRLRRLENTKMPKRKEERLQYVNDVLDTRRKLEEIRDQKVIYRFELESLKEDAKELEGEEYCECVGFCYGKNVYVNSEGEILYLEADENGADKIGDPAFSPASLIPIDNLPEAEKNMILRYLDEADDTPSWFKHRND